MSQIPNTANNWNNLILLQARAAHDRIQGEYPAVGPAGPRQGEPEDPGAGAHDHLQVCGRGHPARPPRQLLPQQGRQDEHPCGGGGHAQRGQELAHQQSEAEQGRVGTKKPTQKNPKKHIKNPLKMVFSGFFKIFDFLWK